MKKIAFCDQKHGLTPLENAIFETLKYFVFLVKKSCFLSRTSFNLISSPFLTEKK